MKTLSKGFTLLELMVVITILGILIALIVPNVNENIQHGKQVGTITDISTIAKACIAYIAQNDEAPAAGVQAGPLTPGNDFIRALTEKYLTTCPYKDKWGNPLVVYTGKAVAKFSGIDEAMAGKGDFIIVSYGRYGVEEYFTFDPNNRDAGLYKVKTVADYEKDLINWNGAWIHGPE